MWHYTCYTDSVFLTDLSFMEEWPCRGKTLERHDGSSSHCRVPVARSQGLRNPATNLPTVFFPSEFSISRSAPALSTHPLPPNCSLVWAADNVCHLFVLRPLWYPLPSVLVTPSLNFTLVKFWFPPEPFSSLCLNLEMSLMSLLTSSFCPLSIRLFVFFFQGTPQSFLPQVKHSQCLTSEQYFLPPMNTNYQPKMGQTDIPTILCGGKTGCLQASICVWMALTCANHLPPYIWWCSERSPHPAPRLFVQILLHYSHFSSIPLKCLKISGKPTPAIAMGYI